MKAVIVGLGYVGLPVAIEATLSGLECVGLDNDQHRVDALMNGHSHVDDIDDAVLADAVRRGFRATTRSECVAEADVVVVCVPTPLTVELIPDLSAIFAVAERVAPLLRPGSLVVLESTTYPGTTDGPFRERLEAGSGLVAGRDFALAFSPERIDPGNPEFGLRNTPKVVGGLTPECTERAVAFYSKFVDHVAATSGPREAELAKLIENTYRHVNIALMNEVALFCQELEVDVWAAIEAASSKPFGFQAFHPGPGVGGHCIPIDPNYLSYRVRTLGYQFRFVELAQEINHRMPSYVVTRIQQQLNERGLAVKGARVLVIGLTYKPDIADDRETPARPIVEQLLRLGADVVAVEPRLDRFVVGDTEIEIVDDAVDAARTSDLVVVLQHHRDVDLEAVCHAATMVFDTRGRLRSDNVARL